MVPVVVVDLRSDGGVVGVRVSLASTDDDGGDEFQMGSAVAADHNTQCVGNGNSAGMWKLSTAAFSSVYDYISESFFGWWLCMPCCWC